MRADCALLLANRDILAGDAVLNWSEDVPIEFWQGVTIGGSPERVTRLELGRSGLNGRIPPELGALDRLVSLNLASNRLTGPVPPELGELTGLEILVLSFNALSGPIPPELGELSHLRFLRLDGNRLAGSIPPELAGIKHLSPAVAGNDFDGCMPWELHDLRSHAIDDSFVCAALVQDRPLLWRLGFQKAMEAPVFGHGLEALAYMDGAPIAHHGRPLGTHNLYLTLLGEAGIVPLLLFLSAIVLLLRAQ